MLHKRDKFNWFVLSWGLERLGAFKFPRTSVTSGASIYEAKYDEYLFHVHPTSRWIAEHRSSATNEKLIDGAVVSRRRHNLL